MKTIIYALLFLLSPFMSGAQIASWNWNSNPSNFSETGTLANLSASALSVSSGTPSYVSSPANISVASWSTSGSFSATAKYWQLSITPAAGYQVAVNSFVFDAGRTSSGPQSITVQYSLDGFATAGVTLLSGASNSNTATLSSFSANTALPIAATANTITFRIWGYAASSTGNFRINNISIGGATTAAAGITHYYLKAAGACNIPATWTNDSTLVAGSPPGNFSAINQVFHVQNQAAASITAAWDVSGSGSKVIVGDGSHAAGLVVPADYAFSCSNGTDISANGTLTINNNAIPAFANIDVLSTIVYGAATGTQAVTQSNYGNLVLSGAGSRSFSTGITGIHGQFNPGSFTAADGGTLLFNGADGQAIPAFNYFNLSSTNNSRVLSNAVTGIQGVFTPGTASYTTGTGTVNFMGGAPQNIPKLSTGTSNNYFNLSYTGSSRATLADSISVANNVTVSSGFLTVTSSTKKTLTIGGNLVLNGGTLDFAATGSSAPGDVYLAGNLVQSGIFGTSTSANTGNGTICFNGNKPFTTPQTISLGTTNSLNYTNFVVAGGTVVSLLSDLLLRRESVANQVYQGSMSVNGTLIAGAYTINAGINNSRSNTFANFTVNAGGTISSSNPAGLNTSIGSNNMNRVFQAGASYIFNHAILTPFPSTAQQAVFGAPLNLSFNNSAFLNRSLAVSGLLYVASGTTLSIDSSTLAFATIACNGKLATTPATVLTVTGKPGTPAMSGDNSVYFDSIQHTIGSLVIGDDTHTATLTLGSTLCIQASGSLLFGSAGNSNLYTKGNLVLKCDSISAAFAGNTFGSTITGNTCIERYFTGSTRRYRFVGFPFWPGISLNNYRDDVWITGPGTGSGNLGAGNYNSNGFHYTPANDTSVFYYNDGKNNIAAGSRWEGITNCNDTLSAGTGYRLFYRGPLAQGTACIDGSKPPPEPGCLAACGSIKTGSQVFNVSCANGCIDVAGAEALNTNDGWNLIANPYAAPIDWDASLGWTKTNIRPVIWIWNPANGSYGNWDGLTQTNGVSGIIAPGQAFFVRASGASPVLSCSELVKTNSVVANLFKQAKSNYIGIRLVFDQHNSDECVIRFTTGKNDGFNAGEDVLKLLNTNINIYSLPAPGRKVSVNYLDAVKPGQSYNIRLGIKAAQATYHFEFNETESFSTMNIYLKDNYLNRLIEVHKLLNYSFEVNNDTASQGEQRFELMFHDQAMMLAENGIYTHRIALIYPNPFHENLNIRMLSPDDHVKYQLFDNAFRKLAEGLVSDSYPVISLGELAKGFYYLRLTNSTGIEQLSRIFRL